VSLPPSSSFLTGLLRNLKADVSMADYTHVPRQWRELNYVPDHHKLYFICGGEGWVKIGDREFRPEPGQLVYMPANVEQSFSVVGDDTYRKFWCHFTATAGDIDLFQWFDVPYCWNVIDYERMRFLFEELAGLHADESWLARIREKAVLLEIVALFLTETGARIKIKPAGADDLQRHERIERFIETRLADSITLEQLAKHVHLHPNYLVRYFNKHFGMSPLKYVNRKRMQKARELLRTTPLSIKEVAEKVGYPDTNHFAKAFRREASFSPTEYRLQGK